MKGVGLRVGKVVTVKDAIKGKEEWGKEKGLRKCGKVRGGVKSGEKCVGLKMGIGKGEELENGGKVNDGSRDKGRWETRVRERGRVKGGRQGLEIRVG